MNKRHNLDRRCKQRLTRAEKNPRLALDQGWFQDPGFCEGFFDRCEHLAFVMSPATLELALRAVEIAQRHGDPHLVNRSLGVLSHAFIVRGDLFWAGRTLEDARERALACCPRCRADHLLRHGALLGEYQQAEDSLRALEDALAEGGSHLDADSRARIYYWRAVAYFFLGNHGRSIGDVRRIFDLMSLGSPRGFFLDAAAFIPIFVAGGDPRHDELGKDCLDAFEQRIKGLRDWGDVHTRMTWARGHLSARLGDMRRARRQLKAAYVRLLAEGLPREAVAATIDLSQLVCRGVEPRGDTPEVARQLIGRCLAGRPDLSEDHRRGLTTVQGVLARHPEAAFHEMVSLRRSFVAPIPGAMVERIEAR